MVVLIHPKLEARTLAQRGLEYSTIHKEVASYKPPHTKYPLRPFTEILLLYSMNPQQVHLDRKVWRILLRTSRSPKQKLLPSKQTATMRPRRTPCLQMKLVALIPCARGPSKTQVLSCKRSSKC